MLLFPINRIPVVTSDSMSFRHVDFSTHTEIPTGDHVGAFAHVRQFHTHEGVDLYCPAGTRVYAMESGLVVGIENFTGSLAGFPHWKNTRAVLIEGRSGVLLYGEITHRPNLKVGDPIFQGDLIGWTKTVLVKDKGRPMCMLHVELYAHGTRKSFPWEHAGGGLAEGGTPLPKPDFLLDPTSLLIAAMDNLPREYTNAELNRAMALQGVGYTIYEGNIQPDQIVDNVTAQRWREAVTAMNRVVERVETADVCVKSIYPKCKTLLR